jgi:hypothetical protein
MMPEFKSWLESLGRWINGLLRGVIAAGANSLLLVLVAPETFSPSVPGGLKHLGIVALWSGIAGAALYLKTNPTPWNGADRRTVIQPDRKDSIGM